jgi:hypothetical protein
MSVPIYSLQRIKDVGIGPLLPSLALNVSVNKFTYS